MDTVILSPDTDISGDWVLSTGTDYYAVLIEDGPLLNHNVNTPQLGRHVRVTLDDFTPGFDFITSVQACITGNHGGRSGTTDITVDIENASNVNYYSDTHTVTVNGGSPGLYCSSAYTTSDGGTTAWTSTDLNGLRIYFQSDAAATYGVYIYTAYVIVAYTVPPILTYTSDDNVILKNGLTELKNGLTIIK